MGVSRISPRVLRRSLGVPGGSLGVVWGCLGVLGEPVGGPLAAWGSLGGPGAFLVVLGRLSLARAGGEFVLVYRNIDIFDFG